MSTVLSTTSPPSPQQPLSSSKFTSASFVKYIKHQHHFLELKKKISHQKTRDSHEHGMIERQSSCQKGPVLAREKSCQLWLCFPLAKRVYVPHACTRSNAFFFFWFLIFGYVVPCIVSFYTWTYVDCKRGLYISCCSSERCPDQHWVVVVVAVFFLRFHVLPVATRQHLCL